MVVKIFIWFLSFSFGVENGCKVVEWGLDQKQKKSYGVMRWKIYLSQPEKLTCNVYSTFHVSLRYWSRIEKVLSPSHESVSPNPTAGNNASNDFSKGKIWIRKTIVAHLIRKTMRAWSFVWLVYRWSQIPYNLSVCSVFLSL